MGEKFKCAFCKMEYDPDEIPEGEGPITDGNGNVFCSGACWQDYQSVQTESQYEKEEQEVEKLEYQDQMDAENLQEFMDEYEDDMKQE